MFPVSLAGCAAELIPVNYDCLVYLMYRRGFCVLRGYHCMTLHDKWQLYLQIEGIEPNKFYAGIRYDHMSLAAALLG